MKKRCIDLKQNLIFIFLLLLHLHSYAYRWTTSLTWVSTCHAWRRCWTGRASRISWPSGTRARTSERRLWRCCIVWWRRQTLRSVYRVESSPNRSSIEWPLISTSTRRSSREAHSEKQPLVFYSTNLISNIYTRTIIWFLKLIIGQ